MRTAAPLFEVDLARRYCSNIHSRMFVVRSEVHGLYCAELPTSTVGLVMFLAVMCEMETSYKRNYEGTFSNFNTYAIYFSLM